MISTILLQAAGGNSLMSFLPMVLIIVVFYFFMIRPQMKKQKEHKKYIEELDVNSKVVTNAGIHGRIVEVSDTTFIIEIASGVRVKFDKSAVALAASKAVNEK